MNYDDQTLVRVFQQASRENEEIKKIDDWLNSLGLNWHHWVMALRSQIELSGFKKAKKLETVEDKELGSYVSLINANGTHWEKSRCNNMYRQFLRFGKISEKQKAFMKRMFEKCRSRK